jgi:CHAD domain-containing protein
VKKLRYIIEVLECLFDEIQVRTFVNLLKSLQDFLSNANDVRIAYGLLDELLEETDHDVRPINRAGGIVLGWHERGLANHEQKLGKHIRRFKHLSPFW